MKTGENLVVCLALSMVVERDEHLVSLKVWKKDWKMVGRMAASKVVVLDFVLVELSDVYLAGGTAAKRVVKLAVESDSKGVEL